MNKYNNIVTIKGESIYRWLESQHLLGGMEMLTETK